MASSSKDIGWSDPSMYAPYPPGPRITFTYGKTAANVRSWSLTSSVGPPNGVHCIITPPGVRWARPAS